MTLILNLQKACFFLLIATTPLAAQNINIEPTYILGEKIVATLEQPIPSPPSPPQQDTKLSILWNFPAELETEVFPNQEKVCIWTTEAGKYKLDAVVIPLKTITVGGQTFDVINGTITRIDAEFEVIVPTPPTPNPPTPNPPVPPDPNPTDPPFPTTGLTVLITKEAMEMGALPLEVRSILTSTSLIKLLRDSTTRLDDGLPAFRIWDDDYNSQQLSYTPEIFQKAYEVAKNDSDKLPWIVISNGKTGFSGPLPKTLDETLELIKKYK